jgi:hypothetical protein
VQLIERGELNAYDILCNEWLVFTRDLLPTAPPAATRRAAATGLTSDSDASADAGRAESSEPASGTTGSDARASSADSGRAESSEPASGTTGSDASETKEAQ